MTNTTNNEQYKELYSTGYVGNKYDTEIVIMRTHFNVNNTTVQSDTVDFASRPKLSRYFLSETGKLFSLSYPFIKQKKNLLITITLWI